MKQSPKQPAEKRRAQLINAALKIFIRKGYSGTTTNEIARAAGLTKGALYFHFKSKEDIFFEVIRSRHKEWFGAFDALLVETDPEIFAEKSISRAFDMIDKQKYFSIDLWQRANKIPKIRNYMAVEHEKTENKIVDYLVAHSALKRRECQVFIRLLHAIIDGVVIRQMISCPDDINSLEKSVVEISKLYLNKDKLLAGKI